jgi:hypothetical protein
MTERSGPSALRIAGERYRRILHGEERDGRPAYEACPDCRVAKGELHWRNCDQEKCPRCGAQLLSCNCEPIEDLFEH